MIAQSVNPVRGLGLRRGLSLTAFDQWRIVHAVEVYP